MVHGFLSPSNVLVDQEYAGVQEFEWQQFVRP